jgi:hypothetical protein
MKLGEKPLDLPLKVFVRQEKLEDIIVSAQL